ncbi:hypothetical protein AAHE18_04G203500 [Arachis hypogaea]
MAVPKLSTYLVLCLFLLCVHAALVSSNSDDWLNHGGDLFNRRYANKEDKISPKTASKLSLKWKFYAGKDISATPAIYDDTIYFPCWNGNIYAVKKDDGKLVWKQNLNELTGLKATGLVMNVNTTVSRSTPTIAGNLLIVGMYGPAIVLGLNRKNGKLVWLTYLYHHPAALITMFGTYYKGGYYVATSSLEEFTTIQKCCIFRGSMVKLNAFSGEYAGAAIWGSSPSIDAQRNNVYIATGNLYSAPARILECQERQGNITEPTDPDECTEPENHSNSILALDLDNGKIKWYRQLGGYDVWFFECRNPATPGCPPSGPNPDADFGEAPMMLTAYVNGRKKDLVVAVQKSGFAWALDRNNGNLIWFTEAGPGGTIGGGIWGAATDEKRVYTNIANSDDKNFTLAPSNITTTSGGWVAMDASNGKILWSTANPSNSSSIGPVSVANDVVFAGSVDKQGSIYAMNANNGKILWSYKTGASVYGGMSISKGCIYVGHGFNVNLAFGRLSGGTFLFAFCVKHYDTK